MTRTQTAVLSASGAAVLISLLLLSTSDGCVAARDREARREQALTSVAAPRPGLRELVEIDAQEISHSMVRQSTRVAAVLEAVRRVDLVAEVEGRVVEVAPVDFMQVAEGTVLARLEAGFLEAALLRSEGALQSARANHQLARLELARQRGLSKRQVTSRSDLDKAVNSERGSSGAVREAEAALADAQLRLAKAEITAPFAGVVSRLDLELGKYLRIGDAVCGLEDLSQIEVEVGLTDREIVAVTDGAEVTVQVDAFVDESFRGVITGVGRTTDPETQKYTVQVRVPNDDGRLLPGMVGRVYFEVGEPRAAIRIPRRAAQTQFEISYVFVVRPVDGEDRIERRRVSIRSVPFRPELVEVLDGLRDGERVAVSRLRLLRDGLAVRVKGTAL